MAKKKKMRSLNIYLNTALIGVLKKSGGGEISFEYNEEWISDGFAISRSFPLQEGLYKGEDASRYFDNLLPDNDNIKKGNGAKLTLWVQLFQGDLKFSIINNLPNIQSGPT